MISVGRNDMDIDAFRRVRVLVYGDVMLDESLIGFAERISPEAPVPVVHLQKVNYHPGGAANVALNVKTLGGSVTVAGRLGSDDTARILCGELDKAGVSHVFIESSLPTTRKTRVIAQGQQLVRVDVEQVDFLGDSEAKIISAISKLSADIVVVSDYAKGCVTQNIMNALSRIAPVIVDPKPQNKLLFRGARLLTPNKKECVAMSSGGSVEERMREISKELQCSVLVTLGEDGMSLFHEGKVTNIPTRARDVYDVTGAGDTVIAAMALGLGAGWSMENAAYVANAAAGIKVSKRGTVAVSADELREAIADNPLR